MPNNFSWTGAQRVASWSVIKCEARFAAEWLLNASGRATVRMQSARRYFSFSRARRTNVAARASLLAVSVSALRAYACKLQPRSFDRFKWAAIAAGDKSQPRFPTPLQSKSADLKFPRSPARLLISENESRKSGRILRSRRRRRSWRRLCQMKSS